MQCSVSAHVLAGVPYRSKINSAVPTLLGNPEQAGVLVGFIDDISPVTVGNSMHYPLLWWGGGVSAGSCPRVGTGLAVQPQGAAGGKLKEFVCSVLYICNTASKGASTSFLGEDGRFCEKRNLAHNGVHRLRQFRGPKIRANVPPKGPC